MATDPSRQAALNPADQSPPAFRPIRILGLTEGDPATTLSGVARFLFGALKEQGCVLVGLDYAPRGLLRVGLAVATIRRSRETWRARFHTSRLSHRAMTLTLKRRVGAADFRYDLVLQVHGWIRGQPEPFVLYLDQTRAMAEAAFPDWLPFRSRERSQLLRYEEETYQRAAHIFTMGSPVRSSLVDDYGVPSHRITVVGGGLNFLDPPAPPRQSAGQRDPMILFVGREFERKGGDVLLEAFAALRNAVPNASLHLVGARPHPVGEGVTVHGRISDRQELSDLYGRARVFCLPSRYEPYGLVFLEAMAHGAACVGTNVQSIPEILGHGRAGMLVPPDDPRALSEVLVRLLQDDAAADTLGREGLRMIETEHTWSRVAERMMPTLFEIGAGN